MRALVVVLGARLIVGGLGVVALLSDGADETAFVAGEPGAVGGPGEEPVAVHAWGSRGRIVRCQKKKTKRSKEKTNTSKEKTNLSTRQLTQAARRSLYVQASVGRQPDGASSSIADFGLAGKQTIRSTRQLTRSARLLRRNQPSSRANPGQGSDLSLSALGVTNQACWVALFADFARTLRVDFREKVETGECSQTVSIGPPTSGWRHDSVTV
jgi:hypothetical protein